MADQRKSWMTSDRGVSLGSPVLVQRDALLDGEQTHRRLAALESQALVLLFRGRQGPEEARAGAGPRAGRPGHRPGPAASPGRPRRPPPDARCPAAPARAPGCRQRAGASSSGAASASPRGPTAGCRPSGQGPSPGGTRSRPRRRARGSRRGARWASIRFSSGQPAMSSGRRPQARRDPSTAGVKSSARTFSQSPDRRASPTCRTRRA